jgi:5-methylcytosine-specific restriction protein A
MRRDSFYASPFWRALRKQALERDRYQCSAPGCTRKATIVDHIVSRRLGGADALSNLRSLCVACDNRIKEDANGVRRRGGSLKGPIGADGWPA